MDPATVESLKVAIEYGLPTVLLASLAYAVWQAIAAAWHDLVIPSRDRAFQFLDKVERNVDTFSDNLEQQTASLKEIERQSGETASNLAQLRRQCEIQCEIRGLGCIEPTQNGEVG